MSKSAHLGRKVASLSIGDILNLDLVIEGSHKRSIEVEIMEFNFSSELLCRTGFVYKVRETGDYGSFSFLGERFANITPFYYEKSEDIYYEITMD